MSNLTTNFYNTISKYCLKCVVELADGRTLTFDRIDTRDKLVGKQVFLLDDLYEVLSARFEIYHYDISPQDNTTVVNQIIQDKSTAEEVTIDGEIKKIPKVTGMIRKYDFKLEDFPDRFV